MKISCEEGELGVVRWWSFEGSGYLSKNNEEKNGFDVI